MNTSLVITVIGPDRPGLVSQLSDVAQKFGANWEESRMASLAGQFAGMVHFDVPREKADALAASFRELEASGLAIVIARSGGAASAGAAPAGAAPAVAARRVRLELVGHDRPGIVRDLSAALAKLGVSIDELHTQVASAAMSGDDLFKVKALLAVPAGVANPALRGALEALANEMMVDLEAAESLAG
jgi:glycine cleavage system regulatory protein